jgi:site-specific DNA recombinase
MLTYFMYCRKSSEDEERQVISNESQEDELQPLAQRDRLRVGDKIKEEASAKISGSRTLFNEMVKRIKKGEANAILCWHLNRLSRNAGDAAVLIELMDQDKLLEIRTPGQIFRNTPGDKFLITLFCSQAKLENDNKGIDVERGLRKKAAMGLYPGVAPMGYLNDKTKLHGERDLYNDPERFAQVKRMWRMMLTGTYTPPQILKVANNEWGFRTRKTKKQGGNPLSVSAIYHIFHNPFYYGWYEYPIGSGKWYGGKHEPMVTKAEFDQVQALLGRKGNPRASKHLTFSYTGLIRCGECDGMITAEEKRQVICSNCRLKFVYSSRDLCPGCQTPIAEMSGPLFLHYIYYHCAKRKTACKQRSLEVLKLERKIMKKLGRIHISAEFKAWAFEYLREIYEEDVKTNHSIGQSRDKAYADCLKRLESLVKLKTSPENSDGSMLSDEEYSRERRKLLEEKAGLDNPGEMKRRAQHALRESEATFDFAHAACQKFIEGDFRAKKQIFANLGSNLILLDKELIIEAKEPLVLIEKSTGGNCGGNGWIEPKNRPVNSGPNARNVSGFSSRLRDVKEVRTLSNKYKKLVKAIYRHFRSDVNAFGPHIWN